jgi:hypothetical protein
VNEKISAAAEEEADDCRAICEVVNVPTMTDEKVLPCASVPVVVKEKTCGVDWAG